MNPASNKSYKMVEDRGKKILNYNYWHFHRTHFLGILLYLGYFDTILFLKVKLNIPFNKFKIGKEDNQNQHFEW